MICDDRMAGRIFIKKSSIANWKALSSDILSDTIALFSSIQSGLRSPKGVERPYEKIRRRARRK